MMTRYGVADHIESGKEITSAESGRYRTGTAKVLNESFRTSGALNDSFKTPGGREPAPKTPKGPPPWRKPLRGNAKTQPLAAMSASTAAIDRTGTPVPPLPV
jgi:hypothetical protein